MQMPERNYSTPSYRYGFQNQEKDDEVSGSNNQIHFKYRSYTSRTGRFWSVDPLASKYPYWSPYAFSGNMVIHARELEGLEAVVGISMGGDVEYRKSHLRLLNSQAITTSLISPTNPKEPSEITSLVDVLSQATKNDPNKMIGFIAIWGHGTAGNVYGSTGITSNPTGSLETSDLDRIRQAISDGEIVFSPNSIILITACNAGTPTSTFTNPDGTLGEISFAQELADITGAKVIAGRNVSGDGGVSPLNETGGKEMSYQMRDYKKGSFFQFQSGQSPVDIGNTYSTTTGISQGTALPASTQPAEVGPRREDGSF